MESLLIMLPAGNVDPSDTMQVYVPTQKEGPDTKASSTSSHKLPLPTANDILDGMLNENWILIDSGSTFNSFMNPNLLGTICVKR